MARPVKQISRQPDRTRSLLLAPLAFCALILGLVAAAIWIGEGDTAADRDAATPIAVNPTGASVSEPPANGRAASGTMNSTSSPDPVGSAAALASDGPVTATPRATTQTVPPPADPFKGFLESHSSASELGPPAPPSAQIQQDPFKRALEESQKRQMAAAISPFGGSK